MSVDAGAVAVVTGAGRGIGRAIAERLGRDGFTVIAGSRHPEQAGGADAGRGLILPLAVDVSREEDVLRLAEAADRHGRLAVWVNNAAVLEKSPFAELDSERWRRVMATNLDGVYAGTREAFRRMSVTGGGVIVNLGSLSGVANVEKFPGLAAYNVSKAAVIALTEAVALEGQPSGVRCIALSPGAVDTDMLRQAAPHLRAGVTPAGIAAIVAWLVTDDAWPLSGTNVPLFTNREG